MIELRDHSTLNVGTEAAENRAELAQPAGSTSGPEPNGPGVCQRKLPHGSSSPCRVASSRDVHGRFDVRLPARDAAEGERGRLKLLARIRRSYEVATETIRAGGAEIRFTRVADPDAVFDAMSAQFSHSARDDASAQPYWAKAWDSNLAIAEALGGVDVAGSRVMDLGCGLGLVGALLAARGARVSFADAVSPALLFCRLNAWPWREACGEVRLDWRCDRIGGPRFDLIVGSDILYDRIEWPFLESFWSDQLHPEGRIVLGEPFRIIGDEFIQWIQGRPWRADIRSIRTSAANRPLRLIELCRN